MQILIAILFTNEEKIKYYGIYIGIIYSSQLLSNSIVSKKKSFNYKIKLLSSISLSVFIFLQISYLYLINLIENEKWNYYYAIIWIVFFSILTGIFTMSKLSMNYLINCVPKNTMLMLSKRLSLFKGIFLFSGIILFYFFNRYVSYFIIIFSLTMIILFGYFFTEKNSDQFYKYKINFNELSEKIEIFNNSGEIIDKFQSTLDNDNEELISLERDMIRESVTLEQLQMEQKIQLEKANQEFNELNQKNNFNISNIVPDKTKFILKNLSDGTRKMRFMFLFVFQFCSVFYRHILIILTLVNYIKIVKVNRNKNDEIQDIYLFKIEVYNILMIILLSFALIYLLYRAYKAFTKNNDIHSIFRFYFYINSLILFIYPFISDSPYLLLCFVIYILFNFAVDNKINIFFSVNYKNEKTPFKLKVNELVSVAYYFGKILGSLIVFIFFENEYYFLILGAFIYFGASFYDRFIKLSKIIILGRSYSKELN